MHGLTSLIFETMRLTQAGPCRPCPVYGSAIVFEKKVGRSLNFDKQFMFVVLQLLIITSSESLH